MTELFLPYASPIVDPKTGYASDAMKAWMRGITPQASSGGGGVTSVGATAPLASSGGTTPVISHNVSGVTASTYGDATHVAQVAVNVTGHVTGATSILIDVSTLLDGL